MRPQPRSPSPHHRRHSGRGFTLIELLIVMTILVILIGLLLPAIRGASVTVRHTAVQSEIGRIATAVVAFKTKYGSEPPSTITLCETPADWNLPAYARDKALVRAIWPQFDFTIARDLNRDGDNGTGNDKIGLEAGESLVFFLGGLPDDSAGGGKFGLLGFSRNPQNPLSFASNANRDKSAYDFEAGRLVDLDNDKFPEFLDSYPGQTFPILYFNSYDGAGYRAGDYPGNKTPVNKTIPIEPYRQGKNLTSPAFNKNGFQLISPGLDHEYGPGGPYEVGADIPFPNYSRTGTFAVTVSTDDRKTENDNITNFGNGKLVP